MSAVPEASWSHLGLGLSGGIPAVRKLVAVLKGPRPDRDCVLALGLLGDLSVVRPLVKFLIIAPFAEAAAEALHIITGAPLFEKQFVPEEIVEDELFEEELKVYKETGQAPTHLDGKPFGSTITALSRKPETWNAWLSENAAKFQAGVRYRLGQPYGPRVLLACLVSDTIPNQGGVIVMAAKFIIPVHICPVDFEAIYV